MNQAKHASERLELIFLENHNRFLIRWSKVLMIGFILPSCVWGIKAGVWWTVKQPARECLTLKWIRSGCSQSRAPLTAEPFQGSHLFRLMKGFLPLVMLLSDMCPGNARHFENIWSPLLYFVHVSHDSDDSRTLPFIFYHVCFFSPTEPFLEGIFFGCIVQVARFPPLFQPLSFSFPGLSA